MGYKPINHLNDRLSYLQCKKKPPLAVVDRVKSEFYRYCFDESLATHTEVLKVLKRVGNGHYEYATTIACELSGKPPPQLSPDFVATLQEMFTDAQGTFVQLIRQDHSRLNFLSYSFVLHKFCELCDRPDLLEYFPKPKSSQKLVKQDFIWRQMCERLRWPYVLS